MLRNLPRLDFICEKVTTGRLTAERKADRQCGRDIWRTMLLQRNSTLTKAAAVFGVLCSTLMERSELPLIVKKQRTEWVADLPG